MTTCERLAKDLLLGSARVSWARREMEVTCESLSRLCTVFGLNIAVPCPDVSKSPLFDRFSPEDQFPVYAASADPDIRTWELCRRTMLMLDQGQTGPVAGCRIRPFSCPSRFRNDLTIVRPARAVHVPHDPRPPFFLPHCVPAGRAQSCFGTSPAALPPQLCS